MTIYLDMDGVLVFFLHGASKLFNEDYDKLISRWEPGLFDIEKVLNISKEEFMRRLADAGEDFWANLPEYEHTMDLYEDCCKLGTTKILSKPTWHPQCSSGKIMWMYKKFGSRFNDYILTAHKEDCAKPDRILIDDHGGNVEKFIKEGGQAILWPAHYNKRHAEAKNAYEIVRQELHEMAERLK